MIKSPCIFVSLTLEIKPFLYHNVIKSLSNSANNILLNHKLKIEIIIFLLYFILQLISAVRTVLWIFCMIGHKFGGVRYLKTPQFFNI